MINLHEWVFQKAEIAGAAIPFRDSRAGDHAHAREYCFPRGDATSASCLLVEGDCRVRSRYGLLEYPYEKRGTTRDC